jgi:hypothetical protein
MKQEGKFEWGRRDNFWEEGKWEFLLKKEVVVACDRTAMK